jgi:hypothetical protein
MSESLHKADICSEPPDIVYVRVILLSKIARFYIIEK